MTTVTNTETLEEIALSIVVRGLPFSAFTNSVDYTNTRAFMAKEILIALHNLREACAKIAEAHFESGAHGQHSDRCDKAIARAIREG